MLLIGGDALLSDVRAIRRAVVDDEELAIRLDEQRRVIDEMTKFFGCRKPAIVTKPHFLASTVRARSEST